MKRGNCYSTTIFPNKLLIQVKKKKAGCLLFNDLYYKLSYAKKKKSEPPLVYNTLQHMNSKKKTVSKKKVLERDTSFGICHNLQMSSSLGTD